MPLRCGIVGLPNVGKSTIFNALSRSNVHAANYAFSTLGPNVGVITVPDKRLDRIAALVKPKKVTPTTVEIVDIAGLVKGSSRGEGLGNQFLGLIRNVDAVIHVIRCFDDDSIVHVSSKIDPVADKEIIDTELQLKDLESVQGRIRRLETAGRTGDKTALESLHIMKQFEAHLSSGKNARSLPLREDLKQHAADLFLLTAKKVIYLCNVDEKGLKEGNKYVDSLKASVAGDDGEVLLLSAAIEAEIAVLPSAADRSLFLAELGLEEAGTDRLIHAAYHLLGLITFFTAGEKEVRAWTVTKGAKAPQAAGVIHSDFEKGFIRAETIGYDDFTRLGSEAACRDAGRLRIEGKEYVVQDGDLLFFRFNV